ncbi:MAG TPA: YoaK family protein [Steroidobacteraceae bacterium]
MSSPTRPPAPATAQGGSRIVSVSLAFTAGFVDTLGFIALFSFFTAHVTGNFVLLGAALVQPHHGIIAKLLALPTFMAAVAGTRLYERALIRAGRNVPAHLLTFQFIFLVIFMALGIWATPLTEGDSPVAVMTALIGVVAMGIQNAASRTVYSSLSPTTVMTGNVTQLVIDGVDLIAGVPDDTSASIRARMRRFWPPVVSFAGGAAAGALGYAKLGFPCVVVPAALVLGLAVHATRRSPK